jgi:hypothetical protein
MRSRLAQSCAGVRLANLANGLGTPRRTDPVGRHRAARRGQALRIRRSPPPGARGRGRLDWPFRGRSARRPTRCRHIGSSAMASRSAVPPTVCSPHQVAALAQAAQRPEALLAGSAAPDLRGLQTFANHAPVTGRVARQLRRISLRTLLRQSRSDDAIGQRATALPP